MLRRYCHVSIYPDDQDEESPLISAILFAHDSAKFDADKWIAEKFVGQLRRSSSGEPYFPEHD